MDLSCSCWDASYQSSHAREEHLAASFTKHLGNQRWAWRKNVSFHTTWVCNKWVFPKIGEPQNGWFIMENPFKNGMIWGYHYFQKHPNEPLISQKRPDTCFHCFYLHRTCTKSGQNFRNKNGHLDGNEQNVPAPSVLGQVPKYGGRRLKRSLGNNNLESSRSFRYKLLPYLFVILRVSLFFR